MNNIEGVSKSAETIRKLANTECGISLDKVKTKLIEIEDALAKLDVYVGEPGNPDKNMPNYTLETREDLKWNSNEREQKVMSATFTVYFMTDHSNDIN